ncbi:ATP-dependent DNA helicase PIF1-like [Ruditapes philippinarum]|uniref:ATP-dependent DNA helicase PIF1-like n=1 Tax=Ruditapes philippinarum TaxID=129788 RepID=UPI00295C279A|nr:ATP-dependent DNA helicase PIF1-like [Ruditapes philippinarum]
MGDGRYSVDKLKALFDYDDNYASAKERISNTCCLIIDEISMLSRRTFELVENVCRHVKNNNLCFGGLQIIGCGDFKQLPPVPNKYVDDDKDYCFTSQLFDIAFPHHVNLTKVFKEVDIIMSFFIITKVINE